MVLFKTDCISARTEEDENTALQVPAVDVAIAKFTDYLADATRVIVERVNAGNYKSISPREDFTLELHSDDEDTDAPDVLDVAIAIVGNAGIPLAVHEETLPIRARFTVDRDEKAAFTVYVEYTINGNIYRTSTVETKFVDPENVATVKKAMIRTGAWSMMMGNLR